MIHNTYEVVTNYCNEMEMFRVLNHYGTKGYALVSTQMAVNQHGRHVMYLFFSKEIDDFE